VKDAALSFDYLDDVLLAANRKQLDSGAYFRGAGVARLGPLVELLIQHRSKPSGFDALPLVPEVEMLRQALDPQAPGTGSHIEPRHRIVGFVATHRDPNSTDESRWYSFCLKAQRAAEFAGNGKATARGLIGALRELETNIHEHSGRPHDGVVGYRATENEFEFVIADSGVGTLAALGRNPKYAVLADAGLALELALTDGVSSFGNDSGRGYGFHDLFVGLANLSGELRFRSGDHALTINGTGPTLLTRALFQKTQLQGFVASIVCRA
jgi:anti-sigma regulatory factor (Ser/Thr protein kinase)